MFLNCTQIEKERGDAVYKAAMDGFVAKAVADLKAQKEKWAEEIMTLIAEGEESGNF